MKIRILSRLAVLACVAAAAAGCSFYRITDPASKTDYYTTKYDQERQGSVKFTDDKTGKIVTLQNTEITKISEETYREHVPKK